MLLTDCSFLHWSGGLPFSFLWVTCSAGLLELIWFIASNLIGMGMGVRACSMVLLHPFVKVIVVGPTV